MKLPFPDDVFAAGLAVDGRGAQEGRTALAAPGGGTGWHYHPGEVFGFIKEGTMTHYGPNCLVDDVFATGVPVKEGVGPGFVHNGRNEGSTPLVMEVVYINPVGTPLSVEVPEPENCTIP